MIHPKAYKTFQDHSGGLRVHRSQKVSENLENRAITCC